MKNSIDTRNRIIIIDIIRGFALFGVLVVNMTLFKSTDFYVAKAPTDFFSSIDRIVAWIINIFFSGNFYTIFSFLFGLSFYIFMDRVENKGLNVKKLFIRRLVFLFIFGLFHLLFIWSGDILHRYAITGIILLFLKDKKPMEIKRLAKTLLIFSVISIFIVFLVQGLDYEYIKEDIVIDSQQDMVESAPEVYTSSYSKIFKFRVFKEIPFISLNLLLSVPSLLTLFLLGFYSGKIKIHERLYSIRNKKIINNIFKKSLNISLFLNFLLIIVLRDHLSVPIVIRFSLIEVLKYTSGISMCFLYMTSMVKLFEYNIFQKVLHPFNYVGKMALTNYIMQSLIGVFLFYGFGLSLFGQVRIFQGLILSIIIFSIQILFSKVWLKHFKFGPLEWIWRMATYSKIQSIRRNNK